MDMPGAWMPKVQSMWFVVLLLCLWSPLRWFVASATAVRRRVRKQGWTFVIYTVACRKLILHWWYGLKCTNFLLQNISRLSSLPARPMLGGPWAPTYTAWALEVIEMSSFRMTCRDVQENTWYASDKCFTHFCLERCLESGRLVCPAEQKEIAKIDII